MEILVVVVQQHLTVCRLAIPPRPAHFLDVILWAFGQIEMDDAADVRFINTHAKRDGGNHDPDAVLHKAILDIPPLGSFHS